MAMRKMRRNLKNWLMFGSDFMYQDANSKMAQVTYRAMGTNVMERWSSLKLVLMSKVIIFIQCRLVIVSSVPVCRCKKRGRRLVKKAILTAVLMWCVCQLGFRDLYRIEVKTGEIKITKVIIKLVVKMM